MKYYSDAQLAQIEEAVREGDGWDIPIAWIIGFIQDYDILLIDLFKSYPTASAQLKDILDWMYNGDPEARKKGDN